MSQSTLTQPGERTRWAPFDTRGIAMFWLGMIVAIAIAAGAKFQAPSLTLPVGLDVGRHVFGVFGKVEVAVFGVLCCATWFQSRRVAVWVVLGIIGSVVAVQGLFLRPALEARALAILAGREVGESWWHAAYVGTEGLKMLALVGLTAAHRRLSPRQ